MSQKETWKWFYKVVRSVLFSAIIFVGVLFVLLYVLLSIPAVQNDIRKIAEEQLSILFTSKLTIEHVSIYPFNEVVVEGVELYEPIPAADGKTPRVARIERLGAGISLMNLIFHKKIIITYVELVGLDGKLRQDVKDGPLNIQFLIDAFAPKDKNKPPTLFDLQIRNIVIRKSKLEFARPWLAGNGAKFPNVSTLTLNGLNADVALPRLSNDVTEVDLRRLEFNLAGYLKVDCIKGLITYDHGMLSVKDFELDTDQSEIKISDIDVPVAVNGGIKHWIDKENIMAEVNISKFTPSEFAPFYPPLAALKAPMKCEIHAQGNKHSIILDKFQLATLSSTNSDGGFSLEIQGTILDFDTFGGKNGGGAGKRRVAVPFDNLQIADLTLTSTPAFDRALAGLLPAGNKGRSIIESLGKVDLNLQGQFCPHDASAKVDLVFFSDSGDLALSGDMKEVAGKTLLNISAQSSKFNPGRLLAVKDLGEITLSLEGDASIASNIFTAKNVNVEQILSLIPTANIELSMPSAEIKGYRLQDTQLSLHKEGSHVEADVACNDQNFNLDIDGIANIAGAASTLKLSADIRSFHPYIFRNEGLNTGFSISGEADIDVQGSNLDNICGHLALSNINFIDILNNKERSLEYLRIDSYIADAEGGGRRNYDITSDWVEGSLSGHFTPTHIPMLVQGILSDAFPTFIRPPKTHAGLDTDDYMTFDFRVLKNGNWNKVFNVPVSLLSDVVLSGEVDGGSKMMSVDVDAPFILQGTNKLIRDTRFTGRVEDGSGAFDFGVIYPTKKGDLNLEGEVRSRDDKFDIDLNFNPDKTTSFYGLMQLEASVGESLMPLGRSFNLHILPGKLYLNHAEWNVNEAEIKYFKTSEGPMATIEGFNISHGPQFVSIAGTASTSEDDVVDVRLSEVDLDYIFDTLQINYVKFGGSATGQAVGKALFSKNPQAETTRLHVKDLSYNNSVLGDGELHGVFDMSQKRVGISADVAENNRRVALIDGGIWIGRDSLSFSLDADKVRIGFLQPFMAAFSSNLKGRASGNALLYGTFSDIDMKGRLFADTISLKVDYTNVTYCGSDSVIIDPGRIQIPAFTLRDKYGNTATLKGELTHRFFHEPEFDFRVTNAKGMLLYDTNSKMNPRWYGRVFGTGSGQILGKGNYVGISADMTTQGKSDFTLLLTDREEAAEYRFLTFTDKKKAEMETEAVVELTEKEKILREFRKKEQKNEGPESVFGLDLRATITPSTKLNIIMDPVAGDKITAYGEGAMNLSYRSDTDEVKMLGKYVLEEGVYNFSLQDIILRDFIIKRGSSISFNGDPMAGLLDIHAAYRVNTNLTDLDASFATDRDLNRTNVPVDAMLNVTGEMQQPDIKFDIQLPTLNDEVAQKVRSIISSDDMMNLQMIYLLALNRFYTPEYMGGSSGGEWAAVASSTISSQLSNILGNITDKFSVAPSFRSDKGDFSDLEVDVALSSRLFNNRLLINGNFGYRDPSTSATTFIGDFDIEYLLNSTGNWRLKAYNHFNDQNYYLKSALTTQGIGIIWRRDFTHFLGIGKPHTAPTDSVQE